MSNYNAQAVNKLADSFKSALVSTSISDPTLSNPDLAMRACILMLNQCAQNMVTELLELDQPIEAQAMHKAIYSNTDSDNPVLVATNLLKLLEI